MNNTKERLSQYLAKIDGVSEGRHKCLVSTAGSIINAFPDITADELNGALLTVNSRCEPPKEEREVENIARDTFRKFERKPKTYAAGAVKKADTAGVADKSKCDIPPLDNNYTDYLFRQFGTPDITYPYCHPDGVIQYNIYRWNKKDGKIVRPDRKGLTVHNRIPYCLDCLTVAAEIYIVEGEKAADKLNADFRFIDAGNGIFQRVATTAGAANYTGIWQPAILNPAFCECFFFGKRREPKPVFIVPDNDNTGLKSAKETADIFRDAGFSVKVCKPQKGDAL